MPADPEVTVVGTLKYQYADVPFCAIDHPLAASSRILLDDLFNGRCVLNLPDTLPRAMFELAVAQSGVEKAPIPAVETDSVDAIVNIVKQTRLVGWLPSNSYRETEAGGRLATLTVPELTLDRRFCFCRRKRGALTPTAREFL